MPLVKTSSVAVRTVEGDTVSIARRDDSVEFMFGNGHAMTFTAEDLREIVAEFAPKPRQPRGPNKRTTAPAAAGNGTHASA